MHDFLKTIFASSATILLFPEASFAQQEISIPAQALSGAIETLSEETGPTILARVDDVGDRMSVAVVGKMEAKAALAEMIKGSDLIVRETQTGSLVVSRMELVSQNTTEDAVDLGTLVLVSDEGRVGILGDKRLQDVPFSVTSYSSELIKREQALRTDEVFVNDPTVRSSLASGSSTNNFVIRGFPVFNGDLAIDGLFGLNRGNANSLAPYEKVEIFRGPASVVNGIPPSGTVGGVINLVQKRATDTPITNLTFGLRSDSLFSTQLDVGRRFGANKEFGARFNFEGITGDFAVDNARQEVLVGALALDYRGERLRLNFDYIYEERDVRGFQNFYQLGGNDFAIPIAPPNEVNAEPRDGGRDPVTSRRFLVGLEYDLADNWTISARYGRIESETSVELFGARRIIDSAGNTEGFILANEQFPESETMAVSLRGQFDLGSVANDFVFEANRRENFNRFRFQFEDTDALALTQGNFTFAPTLIRQCLNSG